MAKYSQRKAKQIFDLYEKGNYTIAQVCVKVGISERCFYTWQKERAEFAEGIKEAKEIYISKKLVECDQSLERLINGYEYEERKTVIGKDRDGNPVPVEQTVTKKHVAPSLGAIIHFQTNRDPENWRNRQTTELTGKNGKDLIPDKPMTVKEAREFLEKLKEDI
jgi:hypothetical protein